MKSEYREREMAPLTETEVIGSMVTSKIDEKNAKSKGTCGRMTTKVTSLNVARYLMK